MSYHLHTLAPAQAIKLVKKNPRRGTIEHHSEAVGVAKVSDRIWADTPAIVRSAMVRAAHGDVERSGNEAAALGDFDRADAHLNRSRLTLDEQAWAKLADALTKLVRWGDKIEAESEKRLSRMNHGGAALLHRGSGSDAPRTSAGRPSL